VFSQRKAKGQSLLRRVEAVRESHVKTPYIDKRQEALKPKFLRTCGY
jgi:hypothetical protein